MRLIKILCVLFMMSTGLVGCDKDKPVVNQTTVLIDGTDCSEAPNLPKCLAIEEAAKARCDADRGTLQERFSCTQWQKIVTNRLHVTLLQDLVTVRTTAELEKLLEEIVRLEDTAAAGEASWRYREETKAWAEKNFCPAVVAKVKATQHQPSGPLDYETYAKNLVAAKLFLMSLFSCQEIDLLKSDARILLADSIEDNLKLPVTVCRLKSLHEAFLVEGTWFCLEDRRDRLCDALGHIVVLWNQHYPKTPMSSACPNRNRPNYLEYVIKE